MARQMIVLEIVFNIFNILFYQLFSKYASIKIAIVLLRNIEKMFSIQKLFAFLDSGVKINQLFIKCYLFVFYVTTKLSFF